MRAKVLVHPGGEGLAEADCGPKRINRPVLDQRCVLTVEYGGDGHDLSVLWKVGEVMT